MSETVDAKRDDLPSARDAGVVLGIAGSARKQGNSSTLLRRVLDALHGEFRTELVFLADLNLRPCDGCHYCETKGACRLEDDMVTLYPKLLEAGAVLLASPAYMGGIASRMQAFMERTWLLRKGRMKGKIGSYIVTGRRRIGMSTGVIEEYFTRLGMTKLPGVLGYAFEAGEITEDQEAMDGTRRLAAEIAGCLGAAGAGGAAPGIVAAAEVGVVGCDPSEAGKQVQRG